MFNKIWYILIWILISDVYRFIDKNNKRFII